MEARCKRAIKFRFLGSIAALIVAIAFSSHLYGQSSNASKFDTPSSQQIVPKDLFDAWMGYNWRSSQGPGKGPGGSRITPK